MESQTLSIRIDKQDYLALKEISKREERSLSWLIGVAVRRHLDEFSERGYFDKFNWEKFNHKDTAKHLATPKEKNPIDGTPPLNEAE